MDPRKKDSGRLACYIACRQARGQAIRIEAIDEYLTREWRTRPEIARGLAWLRQTYPQYAAAILARHPEWTAPVQWVTAYAAA